jgi:hypothetical protein
LEQTSLTLLHSELAYYQKQGRCHFAALLNDCRLMLKFRQSEVLAHMVAEEFDGVFANFNPFSIL